MTTRYQAFVEYKDNIEEVTVYENGKFDGKVLIEFDLGPYTKYSYYVDKSKIIINNPSKRPKC